MTRVDESVDPCVYVVDDDPASCRALGDLVRSFGHEVQTFERSSDFLDVVSRLPNESPSSAILDFRMPGLNGLEVHQKLGEIAPYFTSIIVTAYADTALTVRLLRSGVIAVLDKPFRDEELWGFVQEGLARSGEEIQRYRRRVLLEGRLKRLSKQDRQVLQMLMEGNKNRTMSKRLDVSLRTVENRRRRVFDVMEAESVAELTRMIVEYERNLGPAKAPLGEWIALPYEHQV
jgi:FixJ family two-component response regulator